MGGGGVLVVGTLRTLKDTRFCLSVVICGPDLPHLGKVGVRHHVLSLFLFFFIFSRSKNPLYHCVNLNSLTGVVMKSNWLALGVRLVPFTMSLRTLWWQVTETELKVA